MRLLGKAHAAAETGQKGLFNSHFLRVVIQLFSPRVNHKLPSSASIQSGTHRAAGATASSLSAASRSFVPGNQWVSLISP